MIDTAFITEASWQPIETAPKDGSWVLVTSPKWGTPAPTCAVAQWKPSKDGVGDWWTSLALLTRLWGPTHWMFLPEAQK